MQRIIKFRAWDGKKMLYPKDYNYIHFTEGCQSWEVFTEDEMHEYFIAATNGNHVDGLEDSALMQFTGLTDKNGKEIYEGDILSHHKKASLYKDCPIKIIGAVVYTNGKFETETIKVINENFFDNSSIHFGIEPIDWIHLPNFKQSEVIGNIYENQELCKG